MAERDNYRDDDDDKSKGKSDHRMSRKKRRRLEALKELEENGNSIYISRYIYLYFLIFLVNFI